MRGAIISFVALALLIVAVIVSGAFVTHTMIELEGRIESVEPQKTGWETANEEITKAALFLEKRARFLSLTVKDKELFEAESYFKELKETAEEKSETEFRIAKSRLILTLGQIRQLYGFSFKGIF